MGKRILIIDDDEAIVETLKMLLGIKGYEVEAASDGDEGLAAIITSPPDLVLIDMFLPGKGGADIFRELRANPNTSNLPALFLSSFAEKPDLLDDERITPDMFISKPVEPDRLLKSIENAISVK